jgi:DtxR family Mn-dependent transcriptional regulator
MELTDKAEEILESLFTITRDDPGAAVPLQNLPEHGAAELEELASAGLLERRDDALMLTDAGRAEGKGILRRHCLAERLLADVLDVDEDLLHQTACRFEHIIRRGVDDHICTLLGHPKFCPHGTPIPPGACCVENRDATMPAVAPLADLSEGESGRIAYIHTAERGTLEKLIAMGALPGAEVSVIQTFPSYVFQVGQTQVAVDRQIADSIYVRLSQPPSAPPARRRRRRLGLRDHPGPRRRA